MGASLDGTPRSPKALRILAAVLGSLIVLLVAPFAIGAMVPGEPTDTVHRFHLTAGAVPSLVLAAGFVLLARRPRESPAAMQLLVAAAGTSILVGLLAGDLVASLGFLPVVFVAIVYALDPWKREVWRAPAVQPALAIAALAVAVPAIAYALTQAALQRHGIGGDVHVDMHHYSLVALAAVAMPVMVLVAALGAAGWRAVGWLGSAALVVFGVSGLAYSSYTSAPDVGWSWASVAAGVAVVVVTEAQARRAVAS
jgi:hypothetical protein